MFRVLLSPFIEQAYLMSCTEGFHFFIIYYIMFMVASPLLCWNCFYKRQFCLD